MEPLLYGIPQLIQLTSVSRATLYVEMGSGRLKWVKVGDRRMVRASDLQIWMDSLTAELTDADQQRKIQHRKLRQLRQA
jgi:predicted DNA-binding transcriptional regulator AlpA